MPKTREALARYERKTGHEAPLGIWREVALVEHLNEDFTRAGSGWWVFLTAWGSPEDRNQARDALICAPPPTDCCHSVDFTTDVRPKQGALVFELDKRWFQGDPPAIAVDAEKRIPGQGLVRQQIRKALVAWYEVASRAMPRLPWPAPRPRP